MPRGPAQVDGRLEPGDKIISVNNFQIRDSNMQNAVNVIKSTPRGRITIGVLKPIKAVRTCFENKPAIGIILRAEAILKIVVFEKPF